MYLNSFKICHSWCRLLALALSSLILTGLLALVQRLLKQVIILFDNQSSGCYAQGEEKMRHWTNLAATSGFPGCSLVKHSPANWRQVPSLGQEYPTEKTMATHSCVLAWEIPWTEEPGGLQSKGSQKSRTRLNKNNIHFIR